jgi:chromosome segregation ATPase
VQDLFEPINLDSWKNLTLDTTRSFEGIASFRDSGDPLKRFRAVDNAFSRFEILLGRAQNKRKVLNRQISRLNTQLKGAQDDAEVQKLVGSLSTAQTALDDLDSMVDTARGQVDLLQTLNQNRSQAEEVAAEEISRERNRELARMAAEAEAELQLPDLSAPNEDLPPGF